MPMTVNQCPPTYTLGSLAGRRCPAPSGVGAEDDGRVAARWRGRGTAPHAGWPRWWTAGPDRWPAPRCHRSRSGRRRSVRRTSASTVVMPLVSSTGPMRLIIATASSGSEESAPRNEVPAWTSSRFGPRASSLAFRSARLDEEMPITATSAAMPMAMPRAVSAVRRWRIRMPTVPTPKTSPNRRWLFASFASTAVAAAGGRPPTTAAITPPGGCPRRGGRRGS